MKKRQLTFLSFYMQVLEQVKFDTNLFWKEYQKALKFLTETERNELNQWVNSNYKKSVTVCRLP